MMQPAEDRLRSDASGGLRRTSDGRILVQG